MLMQCSPLPADGSPVDYSSAEIKLADFGLAKVMDQHDATASFMLSNASTHAGMIKGTMWYLSPEALKGSSGVYERSCADDLWSACLVIFEMDTGLSLQQLMTSPGAVKLDELLTKASPEIMPLLCSVLAVPDAASRCQSAAELLLKLDASIDPLFVWQRYDNTANKYVSVHPASSFALEEAFAPYIAEKFSAQIAEMDTDDVEEMKDPKELAKENYGKESNEGMRATYETDAMEEADTVDEMNLEELLAELDEELSEMEGSVEEESLNEAEEESEEEESEEEDEESNIEDLT
jgi:serine/threonine protein kinase